MNLKYRNQKNAEATARYWNKPLDCPDWYEIKALSPDQSEIVLYDVIGWPFNDAGELVRAITGMKGKEILARINSPGGDIWDGIAIFNAFARHDAKVTTRIESMAASIASVIALAGKEVQAYQNAMLMIHEPWTVAAGSQYDFREIADILEKISGNMVDIYASNSSVGKREVREMMKAETYFTAKEAKEKGFIDTIIDGKGAKAQFDLSMFAHVPDDIRSEGHEPTEREIERILRDAGVSRGKAKAMLAGCKQDESREIESMKAEIMKIQRTIGG